MSGSCMSGTLWCVWQEILSLKLAINFRNPKAGWTLQFEQKQQKVTSVRGGEDLQYEESEIRIGSAFHLAFRSPVMLRLLQPCPGFLHSPLYPAISVEFKFGSLERCSEIVHVFLKHKCFGKPKSCTSQIEALSYSTFQLSGRSVDGIKN